jgi:hypothetical protein
MLEDMKVLRGAREAELMSLVVRVEALPKQSLTIIA